MRLYELFGWHRISECSPNKNGYYKVIDEWNEKNIAEYSFDFSRWMGDCSESGLGMLIYWKEIK
jgi:hypothetical protein